MDYSFKNSYSYADSQAWGVEIRNILTPVRMRQSHALCALLIQGLIWVGVYLLLNETDFSPIIKASLAFFALILISRFYEGYLMEWMVRLFDKTDDDSRPEKFESLIHVDDDGITSKQQGQTVYHDWSNIYAVHDTEKTVILISDTLHPVIPAKCFKSVYEKDAFVRACQQRIPGYHFETPEVFD